MRETLGPDVTKDVRGGQISSTIEQTTDGRIDKTIRGLRSDGTKVGPLHLRKSGNSLLDNLKYWFENGLATHAIQNELAELQHKQEYQARRTQRETAAANFRSQQVAEPSPPVVGLEIGDRAFGFEPAHLLESAISKITTFFRGKNGRSREPQPQS